MSIDVKLVTADQLYRMPTDVLVELVRGEIVEMPSPGYMHGKCAGRFARRLASFVEERGLGEVLTNDTGFILAREPDTVRGEDVAFVRRDRLPVGELDGHFPGAPDLAVEVLSPSESSTMIEDKIGEYLDAGCPLVLVLNPERRTATLHRLNVDPHIVRGDEQLDLSQVVDGFRCTLAELFG